MAVSWVLEIAFFSAPGTAWSGSKCKPPKSARLGSNASQQPKKTRPNTRTNAGHEKTEARRNEAPPTRRGSRSRHDHAPNRRRPNTHNGESPRKAGQRPEQLYTGPVQKRALTLSKNAHCTQGGTGAPKGGLTRYTEALHNNGHANMRCTQKGRKAEKVSGGGERPQHAQERKSGRIATQPTLPRRKP